MKKKDTTIEKEAGWEFTLPSYVINPTHWILGTLIIIAGILTIILVIKVTNTQTVNQTVTTQSP